MEQIAVAVTKLARTFGQPHIHQGLSVRRLTTDIYEMRIDLDTRVVFTHIKPRTLRLRMVGNHDQVKAWLRSA